MGHRYISNISSNMMPERESPSTSPTAELNETRMTIQEEYVAGEALTPEQILARRKESFKAYKENVIKAIEVCWNFIIVSAGVFGIITTQTKLFDTSELIQHYLIAYILIGFFAVTISRIVDQTHHFFVMKYLVSICLCAVIGYAATGVTHFKAPKWEKWLCFLTVSSGATIFEYLRRLENNYYTELTGTSELEFSYYARLRYEQNWFPRRFDQHTRVGRLTPPIATLYALYHQQHVVL